MLRIRGMILSGLIGEIVIVSMFVMKVVNVVMFGVWVMIWVSSGRVVCMVVMSVYVGGEEMVRIVVIGIIVMNMSVWIVLSEVVMSRVLVDICCVVCFCCIFIF